MTQPVIDTEPSLYPPTLRAVAASWKDSPSDVLRTAFWEAHYKNLRDVWDTLIAQNGIPKIAFVAEFRDLRRRVMNQRRRLQKQEQIIDALTRAVRALDTSKGKP